MRNIILVINPGSTSTKVALFDGEKALANETIRHTTSDLEQFKTNFEQKDFRKQFILDFLNKQAISLDDLRAVVARGGLLKPISGGTYEVNEAMIKDLREEKYNTHASNLGAILAQDIAKAAEVQAYIVDPVVVDEMEPIAKLSGLKGMDRRSVGHTLNQKAVARKVLNKENKDYEKSTVIVVHLGGGISIGAHKNGRMVDVVNGLDGEGPYSPERSGTLPLYPFAKKIIEEKLTLDQVKSLIAGQGGLYSYLRETDIRRVLKRIEEKEEEAQFYLDGICYQVSKAIGEMAVVLKGKAEKIILTGGATYSDTIVNTIQEQIAWIAPVEVVPGEMEMEALYEGVMRVLNNEEEAKNYT